MRPTPSRARTGRRIKTPIWIYLRAPGRQSLKCGRGWLAHRYAAAADRAGHAFLHTLFGLALEFDCLGFPEHLAMGSYVSKDGKCLGGFARGREDGSIYRFGHNRRIWPQVVAGEPVSLALSRSLVQGMAVLWPAERHFPGRTWSLCSFILLVLPCGLCYSRRVAVAKLVLFETWRANHSWLWLLQRPRAWRPGLWCAAP